MNDYERALIRYVVDGDIRNAQKQAKNENGNKDVFMGCISSCFATLTQCEHTCGRYYTCDTVAVANDLLCDNELKS